jgi:hypothetical protein
VIAEDELAAINMALGASFGGVPAMTVTSGPGLSSLGLLFSGDRAPVTGRSQPDTALNDIERQFALTG